MVKYILNVLASRIKKPRYSAFKDLHKIKHTECSIFRGENRIKIRSIDETCKNRKMKRITDIIHKEQIS